MDSDTATELFVARFSDGRSATSRDALVSLGERGVTIAFKDGGETLVWPYGALVTAEPLTAHAIDALLTYSYMPGATLFVADRRFARALPAYAPHLTARAQRLRSARPWLWAAACAALVAAGVWAANLSPARAIAKLLPDSAREALGRQVVSSMTGQRAVCSAPAGVAALNTLSERLSQAAGGGATFNVVVVDWDLFNAFATPGEQIVLTRGLLEKANGPDEIAGVLAHEMGHGLEMHPETGIVRGIGLAAGVELLLGGSGGTLANAGLLLAQLSYSREAEREADEHALRLLRGARIPYDGLIAFFDRVLKMEGEDGGIGALRSHPATLERRQRVSREPPYAATPALDVAGWKALQGICALPVKPDPKAQET